MKSLIVILGFLAMSTATLIQNVDVNPDIDTTKLKARLYSILSNRLSHPRLEDASPKNAINDAIIAMIEGLRDKFETGFPESNIPPLDPFTLDLVEFPISEGKILKVDVYLRDLLVRGLKDFIISKINFKILSLTLEYEFIVPQIDYQSKFEVDGKVASIINVNVGGDAKIGITDFITWGSMKMSVNGTGYLRLVNFNIDYDAEKFSVYLEGLFENDQINNVLNWVLEQLSDDFFEGQREGLRALANEMLFDIIADVLSEIKLSDIIG